VMKREGGRARRQVLRSKSEGLSCVDARWREEVVSCLSREAVIVAREVKRDGPAIEVNEANGSVNSQPSGDSP